MNAEGGLNIRRSKLEFDKIYHHDYDQITNADILHEGRIMRRVIPDPYDESTPIQRIYAEDDIEGDPDYVDEGDSDDDETESDVDTYESDEEQYESDDELQNVYDCCGECDDNNDNDDDEDDDTDPEEFLRQLLHDKNNNGNRDKDEIAGRDRNVANSGIVGQIRSIYNEKCSVIDVIKDSTTASKDDEFDGAVSQRWYHWPLMQLREIIQPSSFVQSVGAEPLANNVSPTDPTACDDAKTSLMNSLRKIDSKQFYEYFQSLFSDRKSSLSYFV